MKGFPDFPMEGTAPFAKRRVLSRGIVIGGLAYWSEELSRERSAAGGELDVLACVHPGDPTLASALLPERFRLLLLRADGTGSAADLDSP